MPYPTPPWALLPPTNQLGPILLGNQESINPSVSTATHGLKEIPTFYKSGSDILTSRIEFLDYLEEILNLEKGIFDSLGKH